MKFHRLASIPLNGPLAKIDKRFFSFLLVGGLNTAFGYGIFVLLTVLGLAYPLALLTSTVAGVMFNFKTTGGIVFSNRDNRKLFKFIAVYVVVYLVNVLALKVLMSFQLGVYQASALLVLPMAALSFTLNKRFVFVEES